MWSFLCSATFSPTIVPTTTIRIEMPDSLLRNESFCLVLAQGITRSPRVVADVAPYTVIVVVVVVPPFVFVAWTLPPSYSTIVSGLPVGVVSDARCVQP